MRCVCVRVCVCIPDTLQRVVSWRAEGSCWQRRRALPRVSETHAGVSGNTTAPLQTAGGWGEGQGGRRIKCSERFWIMLNRVQVVLTAMFSPVKSEGTRYFFLSRSGARDLAARSTMICKETNKKDSCSQSTEEVQYKRKENKWKVPQL